MVFNQRYERIRIVDLIGSARVGRSTFYQHFGNKDDVLVAAMDPLLRPLADPAAGRAIGSELQGALSHLWQQRALARRIFDSEARGKIERRLAAAIETRLTQEESTSVPSKMIARAAAAAQLTMLRMWTAGEVACSVEALAEEMVRNSTPERRRS